MGSLEGFQKKYLKRLAHHLDPVVMVGQRGISENLIRKVNASLDSHELIKVRFQEFKKDKRRLTGEIAEKTSSSVVGVVGHVAILYRPNADAENRKIDLPRRE